MRCGDQRFGPKGCELPSGHQGEHASGRRADQWHFRAQSRAWFQNHPRYTITLRPAAALPIVQEFPGYLLKGMIV